MPPRDRGAPLTKEHEVRLIERLRAGDRTAQSTLVVRYQEHLMRVATGVLHDRALAEDVVQDTWLAVLRRARCFEGRSTLLTWLTSIALNAARSCRRKRSRVQLFSGLSTAIEPHPRGAAPAPTQVAALERATDLTGESVALEREWSQALDAAIHSLPDAQRLVVRLQLQGYDAEETRRALGITDLARRLRLSRARSRLREKLGCSAA